MFYIENVAKKPKITFEQKLLAVWPVIVLALALGLFLGARYQATKSLSNPRNTVIINDNNVKVPGGLVKFLKDQTYCNTSKSSGIWNVYQTAQGKFAKIAYGCGLTLDTYAMAAKQDGKWNLLLPKQYLISAHSGKSISGYGPSCELIVKYSISKQIEPVCVNGQGESKVNPIP